MSSKVSRPFGVTIVFLLILLSGALLVLAGMGFTIARRRMIS